MKTSNLHIDELATPIGPLRLTFGADGLHAVTIVRGQSNPANRVAATRRHYPDRTAFERYFDGDLNALSGLAVVMDGTAFQKRVWRALQTIEPGTTLSYSALAGQIGNRKAMRAVGSANGRNPLCIVVPCHRVISADGTLGGFSAGLDAKRWLLHHEGARIAAKA